MQERRKGTREEGKAGVLNDGHDLALLQVGKLYCTPCVRTLSVLRCIMEHHLELRHGLAERH